VPRPIEVHKVAIESVSDASGLARLIDDGTFGADDVLAVIGKTEGNGGVNDYTRILADRAFRDVLLDRGSRGTDEVKQVPLVWSGGTDGVLSPHATIFASAPPGRYPRSDEPRVSVGVAMSEPIGVSLIRSSIQGDGRHGNFDAVVRLRPRPNFDGQGDHLSFCAFDTRTMQWTPVTPIIADGRPIEGITGTPALVQSTFGTVGNYEMLVPAGSELRHYWRNNDDPNFA